MNQELMEELLEHKAQGYLAEGAGRSRALARAGEDILAAAQGRLAAGEMFCLRLAVRRAVRDLSPTDEAGFKAVEGLSCSLPTFSLRH